jgi:hypothetical protein
VLGLDTHIVAQDYVNVFDLFDVARPAARVEHLGYTTSLDGSIRALHTHPGPLAAQIIQRSDASDRPYPFGDGDRPAGWAAITLTIDDVDPARRWHDWFRDEFGQGLATQRANSCWRHGDDIWIVGNTALRR